MCRKNICHCKIFIHISEKACVSMRVYNGNKDECLYDIRDRLAVYPSDLAWQIASIKAILCYRVNVYFLSRFINKSNTVSVRET